MPLAAVSAFGSLVGFGLILVSSQQTFDGVVPSLVLASCAPLGGRACDRTQDR